MVWRPPRWFEGNRAAIPTSERARMSRAKEFGSGIGVVTDLVVQTPDGSQTQKEPASVMTLPSGAMVMSSSSLPSNCRSPGSVKLFTEKIFFVTGKSSSERTQEVICPPVVANPRNSTKVSGAVEREIKPSVKLNEITSELSKKVKAWFAPSVASKVRHPEMASPGA